MVDAELGSEVLPLVFRSAVDSAFSGLTLSQPSLKSADLGRVYALWIINILLDDCCRCFVLFCFAPLVQLPLRVWRSIAGVGF